MLWNWLFVRVSSLSLLRKWQRRFMTWKIAILAWTVLPRLKHQILLLLLLGKGTEKVTNVLDFSTCCARDDKVMMELHHRSKVRQEEKGIINVRQNVIMVTRVTTLVTLKSQPDFLEKDAYLSLDKDFLLKDKKIDAFSSIVTSSCMSFYFRCIFHHMDHKWHITHVHSKVCMNKKIRIPKFFGWLPFTSFCVIEHDFFDILQQRSINISRHSFQCCCSREGSTKNGRKTFLVDVVVPTAEHRSPRSKKRESWNLFFTTPR